MRRGLPVRTNSGLVRPVPAETSAPTRLSLPVVESFSVSPSAVADAGAHVPACGSLNRGALDAFI